MVFPCLCDFLCVMNISQIAKLTSLTAKSIRLYEEKGLIIPPLRSESGYRTYTQQHVMIYCSSLAAGESVLVWMSVKPCSLLPMIQTERAQRCARERKKSGKKSRENSPSSP